MRTEPVREGEAPFKFGISSVYQCTWYCYYELLKRVGYAPCYWDRATKAGSYTNGKDWLKNFREPFMPIEDFNEMPSANDIIVFTGTCGHVAIYEGNNKITDYNRIHPKTFAIDNWNKGEILKGEPYNTGKPIGYLHLPQTKPVKRDESRDQIKVSTVSQFLRNIPDLSGKILSYCFDGYFNVLERASDKHYDWYRIDKDTWIAEVKGRVEFIPKTVIEDNNTEDDMKLDDSDVDYKKLYEEAMAKIAKARSDLE